MAKLAARLLVYLTICPLVLCTTAIARAAGPDDPPDTDVPAHTIAQSSAPAELIELIEPAPAKPAPSTTAVAHRRPVVLPPLYASFTALQYVDVHSTLSALDAGASEGNPMFAGLRSPAAMVALKTGLALGTTYGVEQLRKKSPRAAVVLMIALNSAYATVVAHNYAIASPRR